MLIIQYFAQNVNESALCVKKNTIVYLLDTICACVYFPEEYIIVADRENHQNQLLDFHVAMQKGGTHLCAKLKLFVPWAPLPIKKMS